MGVLEGCYLIRDLRKNMLLLGFVNKINTSHVYPVGIQSCSQMLGVSNNLSIVIRFQYRSQKVIASLNYREVFLWVV